MFKRLNFLSFYHSNSYNIVLKNRHYYVVRKFLMEMTPCDHSNNNDCSNNDEKMIKNG